MPLNSSTPLDVKEIAAILPHRYPFLLVDRIIHFDLEDNLIIGIKNVTMNEQFFQGHFPDMPLMPGVLILEALAQTGGILVYRKKQTDKIAVLLTIDQVKFRRRVIPGDVLHLHVQGQHFNSRGGKVLAKAYVDEEIAAEAKISFILVNREQL